MKFGGNPFKSLVVVFLIVGNLAACRQQEQPSLNSNETTMSPSSEVEWNWDIRNYCQLPGRTHPKRDLPDNPALIENYHATLTEYQHQNKLQEEIWLLERDSSYSPDEIIAKKENLRTILSEAPFTIQQNHGLGGNGRKVILHFENGISAIFKPGTQGRPITSADAEVAGYRFGELLDLMVPMTVKRTIDGETGSVQYLLKDVLNGTDFQWWPGFEAIRVFDYIVSNPDRNPGNFLKLPFGLVAIDHELIFLTTPEWGNGYRNCSDAATIREILRPQRDLQNKIDELTESKLRSALSDIVSEDGLRSAMKKIRSLQTH